MVEFAYSRVLVLISEFSGPGTGREGYNKFSKSESKIYNSDVNDAGNQ